MLVAGILEAPVDLAAFDALLSAFPRVQDVLRPREFLVQRAAVIAANPPLQERELIKLASLATTLTTALRDRSVDDRTARLAVDMGLLVLRSATESWVAGGRPSFATRLRTAAEELRRISTSH